MEIRNNHHPLNERAKVIFRYHITDDAPNEHKNSATFDVYLISGNDLILTQKRYYELQLEATDSLRDWKLINVDMTDCDPEKLSRLIDDAGMNEIEIVETAYGKKLIAYSDTECYSFRCKDIVLELRGYSLREIEDMLVEKDEYLNEVEIQNSKLYDFLLRLSRFLNGESRDHRKLLALNQEKNISLATRSTHYLEILARVKDKLNELKESLPKEVLEYHRILS
jgi:hypothetical protein